MGRYRRAVHFYSPTRHRRLLVVLLLTCSIMCTAEAKPKTPEASSTLLQMHKLYIQQPPHDRTLYDILHVSPNATAADITKSYRRLSRRYHPDKNHASRDNDNDNDDAKERLEKVQQAFEILKSDATRLLYHRYGLAEPSQAVSLLTGRGLDGSSHAESSSDTAELCRLMGYHHGPGGEDVSPDERVRLVAIDLVERIRPVVEGRISQAALGQATAATCDCLKRLPLGAQILRCVGRAYKHAGQGYLRRIQQDSPTTNHIQRHPRTMILRLPEGVREGFRHGKLLLTAAGWWGRALWSEHRANAAKTTTTDDDDDATITYHGWRDHFGELNDSHDTDDLCHVPTDDEIRERERRKAQKAMIESTQVEALWKVTKIDLYRTIRQACDLILSGEHFFFPVHRARVADGWVVGSKGKTVDTSLGLYRAAMTLTIMGDIMVERSKEGTAWME